MNEKSPALQDEDEAQDATVPESAESTPRDEFAELRRQNEELLTKLKYLQAEFENYRKRVDRDAATVVKYAHELLLSRLLPIVDKRTLRSQRSKARPGKASGWSVTT